MQESAKHVTSQFPNEHSQVGHLLDAIQCGDAGLQAATDSINMDQYNNGVQNNFDAEGRNLLNYDPFQNKRVDCAGTKRGYA